MGLTGNWTPYHPSLNPDNISIGAAWSFFVEAGLSLSYPLTRQLHLEGALVAGHFSNGALKRPNKGINTFSPQLGICINPPRTADHFLSDPLPTSSPAFEWNVQAFWGRSNFIYDSLELGMEDLRAGKNFMRMGVLLSSTWSLGPKARLGTGLSLGYHEHYGAIPQARNNQLEMIWSGSRGGMACSWYPVLEWVVGDVSVVIQPGFYLYRSQSHDQSPGMYQRVGLKWHVNDRLFIAGNLRAHSFYISDFVEWGIGYRFRP